MKKIIEYFYIFSKLSLSFGLLICLIGMSYILYLNYKNRGHIANKIFFRGKIKQQYKQKLIAYRRYLRGN